MYGKEEALFFMRNKGKPIATFAEVEAFTGLKFSTLANWVARDVIPINPERPGKGLPVRFLASDCCKLYIAGKLHMYGFRPHATVRLACGIYHHVSDYNRELAGMVHDCFGNVIAMPEKRYVSSWCNAKSGEFYGTRAAGYLPFMDGAVQVGFDLVEISEAVNEFVKKQSNGG